MPYVLKFNRAAIDEKIQRLARWLGLRNPTFDGFMEWSLELRRQIGIPHTLAELGVKESHLDKFAEMAAVDPTAGGNPVKAGVPEMRKMYEAPWREAVMAFRSGGARLRAVMLPQDPPLGGADEHDLPHPGPRRHHRRRHHGLLDGLSSGQARLEGRGAAGAGAAERRHDLACGGPGRPAAQLPEPDAAHPLQHRALFQARGRDRAGDRLEAVRLALRRAHRGAHGAAAPLGRHGQRPGRRVRAADAQAGRREVSHHAHRRSCRRGVAAGRRQGQSGRHHPGAGPRRAHRRRAHLREDARHGHRHQGRPRHRRADDRRPDQGRDRRQLRRPVGAPARRARSASRCRSIPASTCTSSPRRWRTCRATCR